VGELVAGAFDETVFILTPAGRALLEDWPEDHNICAYLLMAFAASLARVDPRPLDESGTVLRAFCPNCGAPSDHELRRGPPGPLWHSFCLSCEGRSHEIRMCDDLAEADSKPLLKILESSPEKG